MNNVNTGFPTAVFVWGMLAGFLMGYGLRSFLLVCHAKKKAQMHSRERRPMASGLKSGQSHYTTRKEKTSEPHRGQSIAWASGPKEPRTLAKARHSSGFAEVWADLQKTASEFPLHRAEDSSAKHGAGQPQMEKLYEPNVQSAPSFRAETEQHPVDKLGSPVPAPKTEDALALKKERPAVPVEMPQEQPILPTEKKGADSDSEASPISSGVQPVPLRSEPAAPKPEYKVPASEEKPLRQKSVVSAEKSFDFSGFTEALGVEFDSMLDVEPFLHKGKGYALKPTTGQLVPDEKARKGFYTLQSMARSGMMKLFDLQLDGKQWSYSEYQQNSSLQNDGSYFQIQAVHKPAKVTARNAMDYYTIDAPGVLILTKV